MLRVASYALAALVLVGGCGGGGDGGIGGTGTTAVVSTGVMTKGSILLNGVRYDDSSASIRLDDTAAAPAALKDGMVVKLRGRINADGANGTAEKVEAENEVRGTVQDVTPAAGTLTVNDQSVLVDDETQFANFPSLGSLQPGTDGVEVHGLRDGTGTLRATYIERFAPVLGDEDSVKGTVTALTMTTFVLPGPIPLTVNYAGITNSPSLSNGTRVQVHGNFNDLTDLFVATRIDLEDEEDADFEPTPDDEFEIEGYVSDCGIPCISFSVSGQAVQVNVNTEFRNGAAEDVADNVRVEVEGRISGATLLASKVTFKRTRVLLEGLATARTGATTGTVTVFGVTVEVNTATMVHTSPDGTGLNSNSLADIEEGTDRVDIRGYVQSNGTVIAERVREVIGGGPADKDRVKGPVTAEGIDSLTILDVDIDLSTTAEFKIEGSSVSPSEFFAAVTPAPSSTAGTLVKAEGTFSSGVLTAEEAEVED